MKRSMFFLVFSVLIGLIAAGSVFCRKFFYPEKYVKNDSGEYVNVTVEAKNDPFPIDKNTKFIIEHYYADEDRLFTEKVDNIPLLLGCDKKGVDKYLKEYMKTVPHDEQEKGLSSFQMVSYKSNEVTFRKTYKKQNIKGYYAKSFNGTIVILKGDEKTVFEYTQIGIESLPEEMQTQVIEGYYMDNDEELYSFLENYSS